MTAAFIHQFETWPEAEAGAFDLEVLENDGEYGALYGPGVGEVILVGPLRDDRTRLVVPIGFATLDQARRAGQLLAGAFAAVRKIQAETPPTRRECSHLLEITRFSRTWKLSAVCSLCGLVLHEADPS